MSELYKISNFFNIDQIYINNVLVLTFKLWVCKYNIYFYNKFANHINSQLRNLRHSTVFTIPKFRTTLSYNSTLTTAIRLWNYLPNSIRMVNSSFIFKKSIKPIITHEYFSNSL